MRIPAFRWTLCWLGVCGAILSSLVVTSGPTNSPAAYPAVAGPSLARAAPGPVGLPEPSDISSTTISVAEPGCTVVEYTPPSSAAPQGGELCIPDEPQGVAVILVHGGGGTGGSYADGDQWAAEYRQRGIITFAIDYRLVIPDVDDGVWPIPEQNAKAATQYLRSRADELGVTDIVMHGWSAGARLAGVALTTPDHPDFQGPELWDDVSDQLDGVVLFYGYYNEFVYEPDEYWGGSEIPLIAMPEPMAAGASAPALLVHGDVDFLVPADESVGFAAALRAAGRDQTLWIVAGQPDHGFDGYGTDSLSPAGAELVDPTIDWVLDVAGA